MPEARISPEASREAPLGVSELVRRVRTLLESAVGTVWVEGEISNCRIHGSGHVYLSLKDEKAGIRAVMFRGAARRLRFRPEDGQQVIVRGLLSFYEARGDCQLVLDHMEPAGIGALQLAFLQLRERLEKEGLFAPERKRPIPALPRRIGVVTSATGAAIRDFLNVARRRFSNMDILVAPAAVQGAAAPGEIVEAIDRLNRSGRVDVIVVTRGGGSIEDLWAFNTEEVARAIAASAVPVISAVGHEVDFTIADFAADLRAPTPSAAAEMLVASKDAQVYQIRSLGLRLETAVRNRISELRTRVKAELRVLGDPARMLRDFAQRVDDLSTRIDLAVEGLLKQRRSEFETAAARLNALNPLAILARGYSVTLTWPGGRTLKDAGGVDVGERIETRLKRGVLISEVLERRAQQGLFPEEPDAEGPAS